MARLRPVISGYETASGNPASFETQLLSPFNALSVAIEPVQTGSGTPSPDNVRPIIGFDSASIKVSPTPDGDGTTYNVSFGEAGTVYGGTLNVTTGELTVDRASTTIGSLTWAKRTGGRGRYDTAGINSLVIIPATAAVNVGITCEFLPPETAGNIYSGTVGIGVNTDGRVWVHLSDMTLSAADFTSAYGAYRFVYPLATAQTYQLTPTQVSSLVGQNYVSSNTGTLTVSYAVGYYEEIAVVLPPRATVAFFKRLDTFVTFGQADVTEYSVPLASSGGNTGSVTVVGELTQAFTRQWLIMGGQLWYTTEVNPDNGFTHITVADPLAAFGRTLVYSTPATNILGEYIKAVAEAEYINLTDTAYDMPYLTVTNSDTTTFTPVAPEDGLFSLENLMRDAQARGLSLTFDFDAEGLSLSITPGDTNDYPVVVGDGHTQLISETYAQTAIAKVTVISDLGYPHDYYLSIDGTISTTPPVNRASGEWVTVKQGENNLLDTATAVFAENIQSHKIEFYSDIPLDLYAHVNVRLNGKVYASQITYAGIMSRDSRYLYRCGELATTLTEKVASASSKYITAEQAKGLAPVQSVNGQTGAVVIEPTYDTASPAASLSVSSSTATTLQSVSLSPGKYMVSFGALFESNATGYRAVAISTTASMSNAGYPAMNRVPAVSGISAWISCTTPLNVTATTTIYFFVYQNSGSALNVSGNYRILKFA